MFIVANSLIDSLSAAGATFVNTEKRSRERQHFAPTELAKIFSTIICAAGGREPVCP